MIAEWPDIGSQDIKDVKLGLGVIDIPKKDLEDSYTTKKWVLAEPQFSEDRPC